MFHGSSLVWRMGSLPVTAPRALMLQYKEQFSEQ